MVVFLLAALLPFPDPGPVPDPFPIRRIPSTAATLPTPPGGLRKLPAADFEALVQAAGRAAVTPGPRVVAGRYAAKFSDDGLSGTGTLSVVAPRAGVVSLDPFRQALSEPKWDGGRDAVVFRTAAGGIALVADPANGAGDVSFGWSARGLEEPGETRFDLRFPATAAAVLTLDLPAGRVPVVVQPDVLVTGPVSANGRDSWTIAFGGQTRLDVAVRTPNRTGDLVSLARGSRSARFDLAPGQAASNYEFDLESVRGPADVWTFTVDPGVKVLDVAAVGKAGWVQTAGGLSVKLKEPAAAVRVAVTAVAPFPTGGEPWPVPLIRSTGLSGEETIDVRTGPDLTLHGWDAGDFRVTATTPTADRGTAVTYRGTVTANGGPRRVPTLRASPTVPAISSVETVTWHVDPDESRLTAKFRLTALHGPVTRIPIRLPAGYQPDPPRLVPADPAAGWAAEIGGWVLTPTRPLAAGQTIELAVVAHGPKGPPVPDPGLDSPDPVKVPYPAFGPSAADRTGTLTLDCGPEYRAFPADDTAIPYAGHEPAGVWVLRPLRPAVIVTTEVTPVDRGAEFVLRTADAAGPLTLLAPPGAEKPSAADGTVAASPLAVAPWLLGTAGPFAPLPTAGQLWTVTPARGGDLMVTVRCQQGGSRPRFFGTDDAPVETSAPVPKPVTPFRPASSSKTAVPPVPPVAGWAVAVILAAVGVGWVATRRARFAVWAGVALVGAVLGAVAVAGPDDWRAVVVVPAAAAGLVAALGAVVRRTAVAALVLAIAPAVAQAPDAATVYAVGDSIFAPPAVLAKLNSLNTIPVPPVVLMSATYTGTASGDAAEFDAEFTAVTAAGDHAVSLPLTGVRLTAVTVDGTAAFPEAVPDGVTVAVRGAGKHSIRARFTAAVAATGSDREVSFPIPDVPVGRLRFAAPPPARVFTVPTRRGLQNVTRYGITADLGGGKQLTIHWRVGVSVGGTAAVTAASAAVWDLDDADPGVTNAFFLHTDRGAADRFRLAVPPGLEPGRIAVRTPDAGPNAVRDWTLDPPGPDGWRVLNFRLQTPVEGKATLAVRCGATAPLSAKPILLFPKLLGVTAGEQAFAVRTTGLTAAAWEKTGLIDFPAESAMKDATAVPELQLDRRPVGRVFRRDGIAEPVLKPTLVPPTETTPVKQGVAWGIGPRLTVTGSATFAANVAAAAFAPPPGVTVTAVRGPGLAGWASADGRVRPWFKPGTPEPGVMWEGTFAAPDPANPPLPPGAVVRALDGWVLVSGEKPQAAPPPGDRTVTVAESLRPAPGGFRYRAEIRVAARANRPLPFGLRFVGLPSGATLAVPPTYRVAEAAGGWDVIAVPNEVAVVTVSAVLPAAVGTPLPFGDVLLGGVPADADRTAEFAVNGFRIKAVADAPRTLIAEAKLPEPAVESVVTPEPPPAPTWHLLQAIGFAFGFAAAVGLASRRHFAPEGIAAAGGLLLAVAVPVGVLLLLAGTAWRAVRFGRRTRRLLFR